MNSASRPTVKGKEKLGGLLGESSGGCRRPQWGQSGAPGVALQGPPSSSLTSKVPRSVSPLPLATRAAATGSPSNLRS